MSIDWTQETPLIQEAAGLFGVDWRFICAIRHQENGAPGREFGVLDGHATTYALQLEECCRTVAHRIYVYDENQAPFEYTPHGLVYSDGFLGYFAAIWAPQGASNDPTGLNANWLPNVKRDYRTRCGGRG